MPPLRASRFRAAEHRAAVIRTSGHRAAVIGAWLGLVPLLGASPPAAEPAWSPPLDQHAVIEGFHPPSQDWTSGHRGVDFAAHTGDPVRAIGPGVVAFVGSIAGKPVITIDHLNGRGSAGLRSTYEPVVASVAIGQRVSRGEQIGRIASAGGHCAGRCLHLGVRQGSVPSTEPGPHYLDPLILLRPRAVLKPI